MSELLIALSIGAGVLIPAFGLLAWLAKRREAKRVEGITGRWRDDAAGESEEKS